MVVDGVNWKRQMGTAVLHSGGRHYVVEMAVGCPQCSDWSKRYLGSWGIIPGGVVAAVTSS